MRIFKNRLATGRYYFLFAIAFSLLVFPLPNQSANEKPDPTVTSKQIEALPRSTSPGQSSDDRVALYQALLDLTNPWTVMCIAAHPDDEDGTSLIVMRRKYGAHTVSLFSTFGEGGQNAIGPELYEELGAIRARETMAAAEIQGSEPHFLGLKDFGYSKSADEAFQFWGHDEALRRMVLEIRKLRPDVIITNHSATSNDHGHHQATARLELEAFDAAADPKRFPEQLKDGVNVWQVQRLFVRARGNAQAQTDSSPVVTIDPNEQDPIRNIVYAEEALRALQKHATQGPWPKTFAEFAARFRAFTGQSAGPGQLPLIRYRLVREAKGANALTRDSHNFLDGLALPAEVAKLKTPEINGKPLRDFAGEPDRVFDTLANAIRSGTFRPENLHLANEPDESHLKWVSERTSAALAQAAEITADLNSNPGTVVPGTPASFVLTIANKGSHVIKIVRAGISGLTTFHPLKTKPQLGPSESDKIQIVDRVPVAETITVPHAKHLYDGRYEGARVSGFVMVEIGNHTFRIPYESRVDVGPAIEIEKVEPSPYVARRNDKTYESEDALKLQLVNDQNTAFNGQLDVRTNDGGDRLRVNLLPLGRETITITAQRLFSNYSPKRPQTASISLSVTDSKSVVTTEKIPLVEVEARVAPNLRVGYIRGFDYSLPNGLNALGVVSKELSVDEVRMSDLQKYSTIIVDNRVYESQPELIAANQKLLDYANAGGTLIVFYHKSDEWNPDPRRNRPQLAPYKLILGNERITDENGPIAFIEPQHPLLNFPNKMGQEDFVGWIQERGLYYPREWDPQFHAVLQSNDPGETPLKGGLLAADYGRGHYVYTSMVWYRQLRAGVPGAYRMLANMISYGHR